MGGTGMLGSTITNYLSHFEDLQIHTTIRSKNIPCYIKSNKNISVIKDIDAQDKTAIFSVISSLKPHLVINCIGMVKQLIEKDDIHSKTIYMNSYLPHQLLKICSYFNSRLIHISTDCVFKGDKGLYTENDIADSSDIYGLSKLLGEINTRNSLTLRTSIIGHELDSKNGLLEWFLSQEGQVSGYKNAIFSGLPTIEVARVIKEYVIPNTNLTGIYHLSSEPISKLNLLNIIKKEYQKKISIHEDSSFQIDRSLDSSKFKEETGYFSPSWNNLVKFMKEKKLET
jgi:dTDP-4-dehydrorhamnose reductase